METWRRCNICKKPIAFGAKYWVCNVSTCNRKRTGLHFCDVSCWDAHLPMMNHRESWAEERKAPGREEWAKIQAGDEEKKPRKKAESGEEKSTPEAPEKKPEPAKVLIRRSGSNQ